MEGFMEYTKNAFMALYKLGFVTDQYGWKSEFPDNLYINDINKICSSFLPWYKSDRWTYRQKDKYNLHYDVLFSFVRNV
jgi:sugar phosphate permease